ATSGVTDATENLMLNIHSTAAAAIHKDKNIDALLFFCIFILPFLFSNRKYHEHRTHIILMKWAQACIVNPEHTKSFEAQQALPHMHLF
ncbi:hypothetical protein ACJX0J_040059, partial [Zea mays]